MAEIINLRMARKAARRAAASQTAAQNRARHGQTRSERDLSCAAATRLDRTVVGAKRDPAPEKDDAD